MLFNRLIPILLLKGDSLYKTVKFKNPKYIGDAINTVRIFNEFETDELLVLDIDVTTDKSEINFELLEQLAKECFMPLAYGGGINDKNIAKRIIELGFEKVVINSSNFTHEKLIAEVADEIGSQSVVGVVDVKKTFFGKKFVFSHNGKVRHKINPSDWAKELVNRGVGELIITNIDREGTWNGIDLELVSEIYSQVQVPIIAHGGVGSTDQIKQVFDIGVKAVGIGNMAVFQGRDRGVLINMPNL